MLAALMFAAAAAAAATPTAGPVQKLKERVVEAVRNCPQTKPGEVVVCARTPGTPAPYRLPRLDPRYAEAAVDGSVVAGDVGAAGAGSCSATGGAGQIGCARRDYGTWKAEQRRKRAAERDYADPR
jgi:hypothetical protein